MTKRLQFLETSTQKSRQEKQYEGDSEEAPDYLHRALQAYYAGKYQDATRILGHLSHQHKENHIILSLLNIMILICLRDWKNATKLYHNLSTQVDTFYLPYEVLGLFLNMRSHSYHFILRQLAILQQEVEHALIHWCRINVLIYHKKISCKNARQKLNSLPYNKDTAPFIHLSAEFLGHHKRHHYALLFLTILLEHQEHNTYLYYLRAHNYYQLGLIKPALHYLDIVLSMDRKFVMARDLQARIHNRAFPEIIWHFLKKLLPFYS